MTKSHTPLCHCQHCGLEIPPGAEVRGTLQHKEAYFCCHACLSVAQCISNSGLSQYYQFQVRPSDELISKIEGYTQSTPQDFSYFDSLEFLEHYTTIVNASEQTKSRRKTTLLIDGIHCTACSWLIERYLLQKDGIHSVNVQTQTNTAIIEWSPSLIPLSDICHAITRIGYMPSIYNTNKISHLRRKEKNQSLVRLAVSGICMMQIGMLSIAMYSGYFTEIEQSYRDLLEWASFILVLPVMTYAAQPFFRGALSNISTKTIGMDVPISLALIITFIASSLALVRHDGEIYFDSISMFCFLLLIGRHVELLTRHYSGKIAEETQQILPSVVNKINQRQELSATALTNIKKGDHIHVKVGEVIPVDGVILSGNTQINQAQLTGEFSPLDKGESDTVLAGSINIDAPITIKVEASGPQTKLHAIDSLLHNGLNTKPRFRLLMDRYASLFITSVLLIAIATFVYWLTVEPNRALWIAVSVLVVTCPCALSLATPTVLSNANITMKQHGLLVQRSDIWEKSRKISHIVWDKTGTITEGRYSIHSIRAISHHDTETLVSIAATLEQFSEHPIASAFKNINPQEQTTKKQHPTDIAVHSGQGIEGVIAGKHYRIGTAGFVQHSKAKLNTHDDALNTSLSDTDIQTIYLTENNTLIAEFGLADAIRTDAKEIIDWCKKLGIQTHLLSGDPSSRVRSVAEQCGFDHYISAASPEDKLEYVQGLQRSQDSVMMVGDGVNDVPTLAAADISVAINTGTDLAATHTDAILLSKTLEPVRTFLSLRHRVHAILVQNIAWAIIYNIVALPFAALGFIPPYFAALGMSVSSIIVTLNSLRILRWKKSWNMSIHGTTETENRYVHHSSDVSKKLSASSTNAGKPGEIAYE